MKFELDEAEVHVYVPVAVSTLYWGICLIYGRLENQIAGRGSQVLV